MRRLHQTFSVSIAAVCFCLLMAAAANAASTCTFTLPGLFQKWDYPLHGRTSRDYDTGIQFSSIESVTFKMSGAADYFGAYAVDNTVPWAVKLEFDGVQPSTYGYAANLSALNWRGGQSKFEVSRTIDWGVDQCYDTLLTSLCRGKVYYGLFLEAQTEDWDGTGWCQLDTLTYTVTGTPVPEPSSIIALICGIGGVGGMFCLAKGTRTSL